MGIAEILLVVGWAVGLITAWGGKLIDYQLDKRVEHFKRTLPDEPGPEPEESGEVLRIVTPDRTPSRKQLIQEFADQYYMSYEEAERYLERGTRPSIGEHYTLGDDSPAQSGTIQPPSWRENLGVGVIGLTTFIYIVYRIAGGS